MNAQACPVHAGQMALDSCPKCRAPMCAYCQGEGDLCPSCRAPDEGGTIPWEDASRGWGARFFMTIAAVTKRSGVLFHQLEPGSGAMAVGFTVLLHALIALVVIGAMTILTLITAAMGGPSDARLFGTMLMAIAIGVPVITIAALIGYAIWAVIHHIAVALLGGNGNLEDSLRTTSYASAIGWLWVVVPFVVLVPIAGWVLGGCAMIFHLIFISLTLVSLGIGRFGMRPNAARIAGFAPALLYLLVIVAYVMLVWIGTPSVDSPDVYY